MRRGESESKLCAVGGSREAASPLQSYFLYYCNPLFLFAASQLAKVSEVAVIIGNVASDSMAE